MRNIDIISFTRKGFALSLRLKNLLAPGQIAEVYTKCAALKEQEADSYVEESTGEWVSSRFNSGNAVIFIGAVGIAVRAIAPCIQSKLTDVPVVVMDEAGRYVIPILSGHYGGGNELSRQVAELMNAQCVVTTASDINNGFAIDVFAARNGMKIVNKSGIAPVTSKVLEGEIFRVYSAYRIEGNAPVEVEMVDSPREADVIIDCLRHDEIKSALVLVPSVVHIGMGCRRGVSSMALSMALEDFLFRHGIIRESIADISSIDIKSDEEGLIELAADMGVNLNFYTAEELMKQPGTYAVSEFVKSRTGADNVCERAARAACGLNGAVIVHKESFELVTAAAAIGEISLNWQR